jgi:hypothetical protein
MADLPDGDAPETVESDSPPEVGPETTGSQQQQQQQQ